MVLKIDVVGKYVEEILLGKVGRRTGFEGMGYVEPTSFIDTADYSHRVMA